MRGKAEPLFHEEQSLGQRRLLILTAIPPLVMLLLTIWQVGLHHPWGRQPMSNTSMIGWTVFVWLIYFRLITVKLVTEVRPGEISLAMRGLWGSKSISLSAVKSAHSVTFDPLRDWGGYGVRSSSRGKAFIAGGTTGVELELAKGGIVLVSSRRPDELARRVDEQLSRARPSS
ncbi:MAG TPA: DUF6141 family protein [Bryobacteraceae bacterium]|nr:DUF6141 family protein [Bryobacteraceae bacterium]